MKLLLISLQSNASLIGLKYIAANVKAAGHDVRILFLPGYLERDLHPAIGEFITDFDPDLIGISLMSIEFYPAKNLNGLLKKSFDVPVIWGGVHPIIKPDECIRYADYVCTGEGERSVSFLLDHLQSSGRAATPEIPGIWVNQNGEVIKQPNALPESDLNSLPFQEYLPDCFFGFHKGRVHKFADNEGLFRLYALYGGTCHMLITTRGCPFKCSYCGNSAFASVYGRGVRERSVDNVIQEMKEVKKNPYVLYMNFQDDCFFTHNKEWMKLFCDEYKRHIGLPFIARVIPTMIEKDIMHMLKDAGLCWVVMGIQSGSDRVNFEVYDRRIRFFAVRKAASIIAETGAAAFYEMIVDNPYEHEDDQIETINALSTLKKPYVVSLAHLTFFPGTALARRAINDGIVTPDAYLYRYLLNVNDTYLNKLLSISPCLPGQIVRFLNKPEVQRTVFHITVLNVLSFAVKRSIEPLVFLFMTSRALHYRVDWIFRTVIGNWRSAFARLASSYLGKGDLEYDRRLKLAKKEMPELFEK
jgi:anaerobic magnesium-protoporphyrin IX monomethyl ester cyclase